MQPILYQSTTDTDAPLSGTPSLHGGKGAGLIDMARAGLPVPPALVLTTHAWKHYRLTGKLPATIEQQVCDLLDAYPGSMFSVRSGAPVSMPGMMDTILNVGVDPLGDETYDRAYERFAQGWLEIVKGIPKEVVSDLIKRVHARAQTQSERRNKLLHGVLEAGAGVAVPFDPIQQVLECVKAVFDSWDTPRAKAYRTMHEIPEDMGTACVVQKMVMGTAGGQSGSGVMFSRDPATGEAVLTGEIAFNAQGEEVVAGTVTPQNLLDLYEDGYLDHKQLVENLSDLAHKLEQHFGDVQDIEFTVEAGEIYVLQTRVAKMSARARIVTACALASELHPDDSNARLAYIRERVTKAMVAKTMVPVVNTTTPHILHGLAASPGAVSGKVVFRSTPLKNINKNCILVAEDTSPDDFEKMAAAGAILTATGGFTCHAAVVARGIGVPAVVGCSGLLKSDVFHGFEIKGDAGTYSLKENDEITLDGSTGKIWSGAHEVTKLQPPRELYSLLADLSGNYLPGHKGELWLLDCGLSDRTALTLDLSDMARTEAQLERGLRLSKKAKRVAYVIRAVGVGEDLIGNDITSSLATLVDNFGPDLSGRLFLGGLPTAGENKAVANFLKMELVTGQNATLDLLDMLD